MEMVIKDVTAHTINGCTTIEDVIVYFEDKYPNRRIHIDGQKLIYQDCYKIDKLPFGYDWKYTDVFEAKVYKLTASDLDISNISGVFVYWFENDMEVSIIETKDNRVHLVLYREIGGKLCDVYDIILRANGIRSGQNFL